MAVCRSVHSYIYPTQTRPPLLACKYQSDCQSSSQNSPKMMKFVKLYNKQLVSKLSTTAEGKAEVPLKLFGVNGRYATALYVSAAKSKQLPKVETELSAINELLKKSPKFAAFLSNPTVPRSEKTAKISSLLEEGKISDPTRNLFITLAANGRINEASSIIRSFDDLIQASKGVVRVTVTTAEELTKKQLETLEKAIVAYTGKGKTIDLKVQIKEEILGGLQVMIGDKFVDLSVSSRVTELSKFLETAEL